MLKVYYAHHMWKYGTKIEAWELELIEKRFPGAQIINPATFDQSPANEDAIMEQCLAAVRSSDALVFSHLSGIIGMGVAKELEEARAVDMPIFVVAGVNVYRVPSSLWIELLEGTGRRSIYAQIHFEPRDPSMEPED